MTRRVSKKWCWAVVTAAIIFLAPVPPVFAAQQGPVFLTGPANGDPLQIVLDYVQSHRESLGLTATDLDGLRSEQYQTASTGVTHVRLIQRHAGIDVNQGDILANVAADGSIINLHNRFTGNLADRVGASEPTLSSIQAVERAAGKLGLAVTEALVLESQTTDASRESVISEGGISRRKIPARLVWEVDDDAVLAWDLSIFEIDRDHWWSVRVDAHTGLVVDRVDWTVHDNYRTEGAGSPSDHDLISGGFTKGGVAESYLVYEWPVESPHHNPTGPPGFPTEGRSSQVAPWTSASPFGWHDTDGVVGPESTETRGNNVDANKAGGRPDCGPALDCTFDLDLSIEPTVGSNVSSAIVNLFYWNNIIHDVWYNYGFDEASGNFQVNNYGNGGLGADAVDAHAQSAGNCNAIFSTPVDGNVPVMDMFTCNITTPSRDGDLDNGVIAHEYGHGISNRLTGGPANVSCLFNSEQMGEGWSDWFGLVMTIEPGDLGTDVRPIGTWLLGQAPNGPGVRTQPYSTDMSVNTLTYGDLPGMAIPHGVGEVWASMLWEMTWELIDNGVSHSGLDPDIYNGVGGNNLAMQLVMDGMKLQPCSPGFVDGRDAILLADQNLTGGANQCVIWDAFARRGLGFSADQGSSSSSSDGTEAFDLPDLCLQNLKIVKTATPDPALPGSTIQYNLTITNDTLGPLTGIVATDTIPTGTTYVAGSATCGGILNGNDLEFPLGDMLSGESVNCTFEVTVDAGVHSTVLLYDDLENGVGNWTLNGLWNPEQDTDICGSQAVPFPSPSTAAYYGIDGQCNFDTGAANAGEMTLAVPFDVLGTAPKLTLWSYEDTENDPTYDQKFVEVSTDGGGIWDTLVQLDNEGAWYESSYDLTPYLGSSALVRFRFEATDSIGNEDLGWLVDEIDVTDVAAISNTACVFAFEGDQACDTISTEVSASFGIELSPDPVEVCAGSDGVFAVDLTWLGIDAPVTLSAVSTPPGAVMAFDANPIAAPGTTNLTVTAPTESYSIDVIGTGGGTMSGDTASLVVLGQPGVVTLVAPADGATDVPVQPTYEWTLDSEATVYLVEVATDPAFSNIVDSAVVATNTYDSGVALPPSSTLFWRVTAGNVCAPGGSSSVFSFTTAAMLCSAPALAIPDDDPLGVGDTMAVAMTGPITDLDVMINTTHTWVGDLIFTLTHESGASVVIIDRPGVPATTVGCGGDNVAVSMNDDGTEPVEDFCSDAPALFGSLIPNNPLAAFNGEELSGNWTLTVSDNEGLDTGTLDSWCLVPTVGDNSPPEVFSDGFESGDLSVWSSSVQ